MAATGGASGGSRVKSAPGVYPSSKTSIDAVEEHELGGVIADVAEQVRRSHALRHRRLVREVLLGHASSCRCCALHTVSFRLA